MTLKARLNLEPLQTISKMCRELRPGNATILYHRADVQAMVQSESVFRESATEAFQGLQESGRFGEHLVDVGCPVHRRSDARTRPRCLCILTFFRVLPLRLIANSVRGERAFCELHRHCLVHVDG